MSEDRDRRDDRDEDEDLQELKRRRSRRVDDSEDKPRRRRQGPELKEFSVLWNFGKFLSTCTYTAPEGFDERDVEDFIYDKRDDGLKTYSKKQGERGGRRNDRDRD